MAARVNSVHRVAVCIEVFVQAEWVLVIARMRVARPEAASAGVQVAGAEVVKAEVGVALLAGDGLLTLAFEMMAGTAVSKEMLSRKEKAIQAVSRAAGVSGMIGGQYLDITLKPSKLTERKLEDLILKKTGALIVAAVEIGALLGGARTNSRRLMAEFGREIGLAFQVRDDILDSRRSRLKKDPYRPDAVTFFGMEKAKEKLVELVGRAIACLDEASLKAEELRWLARSLLNLKEESSHG